MLPPDTGRVGGYETTSKMCYWAHVTSKIMRGMSGGKLAAFLRAGKRSPEKRSEREGKYKPTCNTCDMCVLKCKNH